MATKKDIKLKDLVNGPILIVDNAVHSLVEEIEYIDNDVCSRCSLRVECKMFDECNPYASYCAMYCNSQSARFEMGRISLLAPISALLWLQDNGYEDMKEIQMVYPFNINNNKK